MLENLDQKVIKIMNDIAYATMASSDPEEPFEQPEYQQLVKIGERAIPTLLKKMKELLAQDEGIERLQLKNYTSAVVRLSPEKIEMPQLDAKQEKKLNIVAEHLISWGEQKGLC